MAMARFVRALTAVGGVLIVGAATIAVRAQTQAPAAPATQTATRPAAAAAHVTSPKEQWGHNIGDDYFLVDYQQAEDYWHKLEKESNRIHVKEIGKTSEGRPQLMAIITSPANYAKIDRYRQISAQLSHAEGLTDAQAQALAKEGKAVIWIDGGLHASEVLGAQQLVEWVYQMVSRTDEETMRFLNDVIILNTFANPDGMDLISDGYMKYGMTTGGSWKLWNHYAGHDDNRDSYMNALSETTNVSQVMFREWFPQIMYNHHQTGPSGAVMFAPPFRDPFNYNFHPGIPAAMDMVGAAIATRSIEEKMPGVVNREGQSYSTWWNGGFRTIAYFHNELGILTETIGNPTPMPNTPPLTTRFLIGNMSNWYPITPTGDNVWHFRRSWRTARSSTSHRSTARRSSIASMRWDAMRSSSARKITGRSRRTSRRASKPRRAARRRSRPSPLSQARRRPAAAVVAALVAAAGEAAVAAADAAAAAGARSCIRRSRRRTSAIRGASSFRPTSLISARPFGSSTR
jgi:hypothetical protein